MNIRTGVPWFEKEPYIKNNQYNVHAIVLKAMELGSQKNYTELEKTKIKNMYRCRKCGNADIRGGIDHHNFCPNCGGEINPSEFVTG